MAVAALNARAGLDCSITNLDLDSTCWLVRRVLQWSWRREEHMDGAYIARRNHDGQFSTNSI